MYPLEPKYKIIQEVVSEDTFSHPHKAAEKRIQASRSALTSADSLIRSFLEAPT